MQKNVDKIYNLIAGKSSCKGISHKIRIRRDILIVSELLIIAAFIFSYILYGVNRTDRGEVCIYDNILYSEYYGFEMILLISFVVIIQSQLKNSHRCAVIVRYTSIRSYWNNICKNIVSICIDVTSLLLMNCLVLSIILKMTNVCNKVCNWNMDNSRFKYVTGFTMEKYPAIYEFAIYLFVEIFSVLFISVIITQIFYWISGNRSIGILAAIIWIGLDRYTYITNVLFSVITMMPGRMVRKYGITPIRCFVYPLLMCVLMYIISLYVVKKKDIMYRE